MQMMMLNSVLSEIGMPNSVFKIKYRKADGSIGEKLKCIRRGTNMTDRQKSNRNGTLRLYDLITGKDFDVTIDLLIEFNGLKIKMRNDQEEAKL